MTVGRLIHTIPGNSHPCPRPLHPPHLLSLSLSPLPSHPLALSPSVSRQSLIGPLETPTWYLPGGSLPELKSFDAEVAHSGARLIDTLTATAPEDRLDDELEYGLECGVEDGLAPPARDEAPDGSQSERWPAAHQVPPLVRTSSQQNSSSSCVLRHQVSEDAGLVGRLDTKLEDARTKGNQASKLIFFENLFFNLDVDGGGSITFDEMRRMLAFTALSMTTEEREAALREADTDLSDGKLTRGEFMDLCVQHLSEHSLEELEAAARSYAEFRQALKRRANTYWVGIAGRIDWHARFWIPFAYVTEAHTMHAFSYVHAFNALIDMCIVCGTGT